MINQSPKISVIVNTLNRAEYLESNLESLKKLHYPNREIIVVNGPSKDRTTELLEKYTEIRKYNFSKANLSASRNFGILKSEGEYVAFIDDDATANEFWLDELLDFMKSESLSAAGGIVYDVPSQSILWERVMSDEFGNISTHNSKVITSKEFEKSRKFLYLAGCNMMFKKKDLLSVGGFNRFLKYGYDDVEVASRLHQHGFKLDYTSSAEVRHMRAPSSIRDINREILDESSYLQSQIIFILQTGNPKKFAQNNLFIKEIYKEKKLNLIRRYEERKLSKHELNSLQRKLFKALINGHLIGAKKRPNL